MNTSTQNTMIEEIEEVVEVESTDTTLTIQTGVKAGSARSIWDAMTFAIDPLGLFT